MAHNIKSPGVSVQIKDQTAFLAIVSGTVAAAVGFAQKGSINEPTLILSKEEFVNTFGEPISDNYYLGMFADKFLDESVCYFTRIAKEADYEGVLGTVAPGLNFTTMPTPEFWVELAGFPEPNNGIYKVSWAGSTTYANLAALVTAVDTAMNLVILADGTTTLGSYLTASASLTFLKIASDLYRNVIITMRASEDATNNVIKTTGNGHLGMADNSTSTDVGSYAYSWIRVPISEVPATVASIVGSTAIAITDLNQLSAFNKINLLVDGTGTNPYKTYSDVNVVPATGSPATFPMLQALVAPTAHDWVGETFTIALAGFYHFMVGDLTAGVNTTHTVTLTFDNDPVSLSGFIVALNAALALVSTGTNTLDDYIQFAVFETTKVQIIEGAGARKNYGSLCTITVAAGTATLPFLGFSSPTNNSSLGTDTTYTAAGVAVKITALVAEIIATAASNILTISSDRLGTTSFVKINTATTAVDSALPILKFTTATSDTGSNSSNQGVVNFVARDAGTAGDLLKVRTYSSVNPVTLATQYYIEVYDGEDSVEVWGPVNWTLATATNYVKTVIENSTYIRLDFGETLQYPNTDTGIPPTISPPNNADLGMPEFWQLASGNDGIPNSGTESDALVITALDEYNDREQYEIDLLLAPGFSGAAVVAKLQSIGESRQDIIVLPDPPAFLTYIQIIDWHNGTYLGSTPLTSSYSVIAWDWQRDFDAYNQQYVDLPPSIYEAIAMARTERNFELWEAPAGPERGIVNSISSYSKPSQAQREFLYNDTDPACVNPIVQFPTEGIIIYGQKTCLKQDKSTNRINVRRLVNFVKRNVEKIGKRYLFTLNQASTWASIAREISSFLSNIQERGGLQAYSVVFDASTNTADRVDAGVMYGKIFIQPTRVAERIFIDLTIQRTGALAAEA